MKVDGNISTLNFTSMTADKKALQIINRMSPDKILQINKWKQELAGKKWGLYLQDFDKRDGFYTVFKYQDSEWDSFISITPVKRNENVLETKFYYSIEHFKAFYKKLCEFIAKGEKSSFLTPKDDPTYYLVFKTPLQAASAENALKSLNKSQDLSPFEKIRNAVSKVKILEDAELKSFFSFFK